MDDCFELLMEFAFFREEHLHSALVYLQDGSPEPEDMRVANIVLEFKRAAD